MTSLIAHRLDAVIDGAIAAERIVGAVVLMSRNGERIYARAAGFADREAGTKMREDAIFRLASVTKLFTATAALALIERGTLDLDRPVTDWLPDFAPRFEGRPVTITLRQLVSHSAGLGYGFLEPEDGPLHRAGVSDGMDRSPLTLAENVRRIAAAPLLFAPGTGFCYSLGIDIAGAVIEAATNRSLPDVVRDLVAAPLGLSDAGFVLTDPERLAAAYADDLPRPRRMREPDVLPFVPGMDGVVMDPSRIFQADAFPSGGAGMAGTAGDVLALLDALAYGGAPILSPALVAEMGRDQIEGIAIEGSPGWGYGLGFAVLRDAAAAGVTDAAGAWRWGGAYGHSWLVDRARGLTLVALTNTAFEGMWNGGRFPADLGRERTAEIGGEAARMLRFDGQVALVTGAGRGLGLAYARLLAERGAHVVVHDVGAGADGSGHDPAVAAEAAASIAAQGGRAEPASDPIDTRDACRRLVEGVLARHGRLDVLIHNAGWVSYHPVEEIDEATFARTMGIGAAAPLWLAQAAWDSMKRQGHGRIVVTTSDRALYPCHARKGLAAYAAAKMAVLGLVNVLAVEGAAHGIVVNALSPVARTRMWGETGEPDDLWPVAVAPGAVFLASASCTEGGWVLRAMNGQFRFTRAEKAAGIDYPRDLRGFAADTPDDLAAAWSRKAPCLWSERA